MVHHKGTVAMIQIATVPFNYDYLKVLDIKDFWLLVGSNILEIIDRKGNLLIFGFILFENCEPIQSNLLIFHRIIKRFIGIIEMYHSQLF